MEDPQVKHLEMAKAVKHPKLGDIELVGQAVKLSRSPLREFTAAPERGEHNADVYAMVGVDAAALAKLKADGVI
jgi:crotonobetainyl-CoA:carnitine CoA-transferase CaiB-like acyl-CoA transferase